MATLEALLSSNIADGTIQKIVYFRGLIAKGLGGLTVWSEKVSSGRFSVCYPEVLEAWVASSVETEISSPPVRSVKSLACVIASDSSQWTETRVPPLARRPSYLFASYSGMPAPIR